MIIVEIEVPATGKTYDFEVDENVMAGDVIKDIAGIICRAEQYGMAGVIQDLTLWRKDTKQRLRWNMTIEECGIRNGSELLLI